MRAKPPRRQKNQRGGGSHISVCTCVFSLIPGLPFFLDGVSRGPAEALQNGFVKWLRFSFGRTSFVVGSWAGAGRDTSAGAVGFDRRRGHPPGPRGTGRRGRI